ncbi:hypothetical protein [Caulobacter sp. 17J65-9]|uniref:hypothetical protein n=1 Tax=Caulobacter sp. 17J65-9 TaxID=2709382 RepID=UPI0013C62D31|nr:hypothetical protein [Caulobacter sp. 17J65-9]NEX95320.1 hypothetical protein [Caulobacter sp. 17J65-9]
MFRTATGFDTAFTLDAQGVLRRAKGTQSYRPMHLLDGVRLTGTWGVFDPNGGPPVVTINFTPDGRFREAGLLNFTAWAKLGPDPASRKAVEQGAGTYAVRRGTLELRYDGGPVARFMVATPPAVAPGPAPKTLQVGAATLDRAP